MQLENEGNIIAYDHLEGENVCVIFCMGFNSNRQGNKALELETMCRNKKLEYVRFDYCAHGESSGRFAESNISLWLQDTLTVIDQVAINKKVILVGSSMGGWLALLVALQRREIVKGVLLLACAADMTHYYDERLSKQGLTPQTDASGNTYFSVPNNYDDQQPYRIYQQLLEDGQRHFILSKPIELDIPVRLIHGMQDDVVPWQRSQQVVEQLKSQNVIMSLVKSGDHRLSESADLVLLEQQLDDLLQQI